MKPALLFRIMLLSGTILLLQINISSMYSQPTDTLKGRNLYKPIQPEVADTIKKPGQVIEVVIPDSAWLEKRAQFIRDSVLAREQYVRDSIQRKHRMRDSVTFLRNELQVLLEAYFRAIKDDIILKALKIELVGDTALGDFVYTTLPFGVRDPYVPWRMRNLLTGKQVQFTVNEKTGKISAVRTPQIRASFEYGGAGNLIVIQQPPVVQNNNYGSFYKTPVDSVFLDRNKRIAKIKRYVQFYSLVNKNQRGDPLFLNRTQVRQFEYGQGGVIVKYQEVRFCERYRAYEANKVCSILNFAFSKEGNTYRLTRRNDPINNYSDGTYTFEFDNNENLSAISFKNTANTESWARTIEMNPEGNVSCYFDKANNLITQSICFVYHDKDPRAKYTVETITTTFEKDGISYLQRNNTTGQSRTRDRMTLEWSPWR